MTALYEGTCWTCITIDTNTYLTPVPSLRAITRIPKILPTFFCWRNFQIVQHSVRIQVYCWRISLFTSDFAHTNSFWCFNNKCYIARIPALVFHSLRFFFFPGLLDFGIQPSWRLGVNCLRKKKIFQLQTKTDLVWSLALRILLYKWGFFKFPPSLNFHSYSMHNHPVLVSTRRLVYNAEKSEWNKRVRTVCSRLKTLADDTGK